MPDFTHDERDSDDPVLLSTLADELYKLDKKYQARKKAAEAKLAPLKAERDNLEERLLSMMLDSKQEALSTKRTTIAVKRTQFAELFDDKAFFAYVGRRKAWDLVRKQPVISACKERWDVNLTIPGVRPGVKTDLSITTRRKS